MCTGIGKLVPAPDHAFANRGSSAASPEQISVRSTDAISAVEQRMRNVDPLGWARRPDPRSWSGWPELGHAVVQAFRSRP